MHESCPALTSPLEEYVCAEHIGVNELSRTEYRPIDMGLRSEVDADVAAIPRAAHNVTVSDITLNEVMQDAVEIRAISRVRELVENHDGVAAAHEAFNKTATDEAASSRNEHAHTWMLAASMQARLQYSAAS